MFSKERNLLPILNQDDEEEKDTEEPEAMMENQGLGDEEEEGVE